MDDIDIDDYSRDRSPSARDYQAPRGGDPRRERRASGRGDRREEVIFDRSDREGGKRETDHDERRGGFSRRDRDIGDRRDRGSYRDRDGYRERERGDRKDVERNYENSIFIGNIPFRTTTREVEALFGRDSRIVHADVIINRGKPRGMATVEFASKQEAADAIARFDGTNHFGRELFVRQDYPPPEERRRGEGRDDRRERREERPPKERRERVTADPPSKVGTEVWVGNLPFATNWRNLKDMMRSAGAVSRADVIQDRWGRSRGFGTVFFSTPEDAQAAIERFNGETYEGRQLEVRLSRDPRERRKPELRNSSFTEGVTGEGDVSNVIYADNLPYITTETDLHELFETIGRVNKAEIQYNHQGRPNGTAVVEFESPELAEVAINNLNGYSYGGRSLKISYARRSEPLDAPMGTPMDAEPIEQYADQGAEGDAIDEEIQDAPEQS